MCFNDASLSENLRVGLSGRLDELNVNDSALRGVVNFRMASPAYFIESATYYQCPYPYGCNRLLCTLPLCINTVDSN